MKHWASLAGLVLLATSLQADWKIQVVADTPPPKEISKALRPLFNNRCVQLKRAEAVVAELWLRREVPVQATEVQLSNGLTFAEVPVSTPIAVLRVQEELIDYRKQKVPVGVYTLRLGEQPRDGDHAGTAPTTDFLLVCPADEDRKPDRMDMKDLKELSTQINDSHPTVLLLFPGKGATAEPKLVAQPKDHQVLLVQLPARAATGKAVLSLGLTLVGSSPRAPGG